MTYYLYDYILHLQTPNGSFHIDPILEEYTYGDTEREADWILSNIKPDDIVFFHVTIKGDQYITASTLWNLRLMVT